MADNRIPMVRANATKLADPKDVQALRRRRWVPFNELGDDEKPALVARMTAAKAPPEVLAALARPAPNKKAAVK